MPANSKYIFISPDLRKQMEEEALQKGAFPTARKYHKSVGMSEIGLVLQLRKVVKRDKPQQTTDRKLTEEEQMYLDRLEKGEVSLDEIKGFVARKVFEQVLRNPEKFPLKFLDLFRVELLKNKQAEMEMKNRWGQEIIARFFAGKLPPPICPKCGFDYRAKTVLEGEVTDNGAATNSADF